MPTVTVDGSVTLQDAATALQEHLGNDIEVETHGHGRDQHLRVRRSSTSSAKVSLDHSGGSTTFHVRGGGLLISRMVNELGIAKLVTAAISETYGPKPAPAG
jgi:hypothetical protein